MSLAFLACVEPGYLESQTVLLCRSIRRHAGKYRDAAIYTYQPRHGGEVFERSTRQALEELGVLHSTEVLNREAAHYGFSNKIFAGARAEETLAEDVLVFLDSDTLFTREPPDLDLPEGTVAAARPGVMHAGGISSTGPDDPRDEYWRSIYRRSGIEGEPFVQTDVDRLWVRAYFNAGLVAVERSAGLFAQWQEDFLLLLREQRFPPDPKRGIKNLDEISLALTLARVFARLRILDPTYNYPLHRRGQLASPLREAQLEDLVHVHYHGWFHQPGYLQSLQPAFDPQSPILQWLGRHLPLTPLLEGN